MAGAGNAGSEKPNPSEVFEKVAESLSGKLDQMRSSSEVASQDLIVGIERLRGSVEQSQSELVAKLGQLAERVERLERQAAPASLAPVAQAQPSTATSPAKPVPSPAQQPALSPATGPRQGIEATVLKQWRVREVLNGIALLEGPRGLLGVSRGQVIPGVGRVESIERRGNRWVVATSKGLITTH